MNKENYICLVCFKHSLCTCIHKRGTKFTLLSYQTPASIIHVKAIYSTVHWKCICHFSDFLIKNKKIKINIYIYITNSIRKVVNTFSQHYAHKKSEDRFTECWVVCQ